MSNAFAHASAVAGSVLASSIGLWRGSLVVKAAPQPAAILDYLERTYAA